MRRRRFLQGASIVAAAGLAGCGELLKPEDAQNAARNYKDAYFVFEEARDHVIRARLAADDGRSQVYKEELQLAITKFDTAQLGFEDAAKLTSKGPRQNANRAGEKASLLKSASQARLNGDSGKATQLETQARKIDVVTPRLWRASTSL